MRSKVIVITGTSSGSGLMLANSLQGKGYKVYGLSRSSNGNEKFRHIMTDISDKDNVKRSFSQIFSETDNKIDALINNAGIGMIGSVEDGTREEVERLLNVNLYGTIYTMQEVLPVMRQQRSGHILNVSSIASSNGLPFRGYYSASKAMIDRLVESIRLENRNTGVEIATLNFGDMKTNVADRRVMSKASIFYKNMNELIIKHINDDVDNGMATEKLVPIIEKILNKRNLKPHYYIGKPLQKFSVKLKNLIPQKVFENIIAKYSKLD